MDFDILGWPKNVPFPSSAFTIWGEWNDKDVSIRRFAGSPELEELPMDSRPIAIDLFSGCGGFSLGLVQAGWRIVAAVENSYYSMLTYIYNIPCFQKAPLHFYFTDIHEVTGANITKALRGRRVDLIVGGPPCQSFSKSGPREIGDERDLLLWQFGRVIKELQPKCYVMENVPDIATKAFPNGKGVIVEWLKYMEAGKEQIDKAQENFEASLRRKKCRSRQKQ